MDPQKYYRRVEELLREELIFPVFREQPGYYPSLGSKGAVSHSRLQDTTYKDESRFVCYEVYFGRAGVLYEWGSNTVPDREPKEWVFFTKRDENGTRIVRSFDGVTISNAEFIPLEDTTADEQEKMAKVLVPGNNLEETIQLLVEKPKPYSVS